MILMLTKCRSNNDTYSNNRKCPIIYINAAINILRFGLNHISAGTVDYTGGEEVRANLLRGRSSAKPEAHESLAHG
jgi:hypothetical protein